jgi:hypothetical protein
MGCQALCARLVRQAVAGRSTPSGLYVKEIKANQGLRVHPGRLQCLPEDHPDMPSLNEGVSCVPHLPLSHHRMVSPEGKVQEASSPPR